MFYKTIEGKMHLKIKSSQIGKSYKKGHGKTEDEHLSCALSTSNHKETNEFEYMWIEED